jgi:hypothetical protein
MLPEFPVEALEAFEFYYGASVSSDSAKGAKGV